jgi:hypothetical protein
MSLFDVFRPKGTLTGELVLADMPECKMLSATVHFFQARTRLDSLPYEGNPPPTAYHNEVSIREAEDPSDKPLRFSVSKAAGFYHIDVGVIAYREVNGRMFAQVEHFFPLEHPCEIQAGEERMVVLRVRWPNVPLEELHHYGTVFPETRD